VELWARAGQRRRRGRYISPLCQRLTLRLERRNALDDHRLARVCRGKGALERLSPLDAPGRVNGGRLLHASCSEAPPPGSGELKPAGQDLQALTSGDVVIELPVLRAAGLPRGGGDLRTRLVCVLARAAGRRGRRVSTWSPSSRPSRQSSQRGCHCETKRVRTRLGGPAEGVLNAPGSFRVPSSRADGQREGATV